jgi:hypothetical protein
MSCSFAQCIEILYEGAFLLFSFLMLVSSFLHTMNCTKILGIQLPARRKDQRHLKFLIIVRIVFDHTPNPWLRSICFMKISLTRLLKRFTFLNVQ